MSTSPATHLCPRSLAWALAVALAFAPGCRCGEESREPVARAPVGTVPEDVPRDLSPLPKPPELQIPQQGIPTGPLTVVAARPQGEIRGEVRPAITFSKPVKSLAMVEEASKEPPVARIEPSLEGEWKWLGSASAELVPKGLVPYATPFKVTVPKGVRALDGSELAADFTFEFTTPRPELQQTAPHAGYRWLKPEQTFKLLFNQPVRKEDLEKLAQLEIQGEPKPWPVHVVSTVSIAEERRKAEEEAKKQGRRYEREDFEERGFKNRQQRYELAGPKAFPLDRAVKLHIGSGVRGADGPLTLAADVDLSFRTYGPLQLTQSRMCTQGGWRCPYGPLVVLTSNRVDVASLKKLVTVKPAVAIDWDRAESWAPEESYEEPERSPYFALPGKFRPGKRYEISIVPGAKDELGQVAGGFSGGASTDNLEPELNTGGMEAVIEASAGTRLPVEVTNLKTIEYELWKPALPELAQLLADPWRKDFFSRWSDAREVEELHYARNEKVVHGVDLSKLFEGKPAGIAAVKLNSRDLEHYNDRGFRLVAQVTDLAAHLKVAPKRSLVWVTRLSDGKPVSGAGVEAFDRQGKSLWQGKTDESGFADLPGAVELGVATATNSWEYPYLMVAAKVGDDTCVTADTWTEGINPHEFSVTPGWEGEVPWATGLVFTDRGIYRPGDKVFIKGVARFRQVGALKAPAAGSTMKLTVTDSRGNKVKESEVKVTKYGTFASEVQLPKDAPTGYFGITAVGAVGEKPLSFGDNFRVEEYRAPQFKVDVEVAKKELLAGEPLEATVFARYLFGGAMNDAQARWSVQSHTAEFSPEGAGGFSFGQETWWWDDNQAQPTGGFFGSGEGRVDAKGALPVKAGNVTAEGQRTYEYTLEAEVTDVNRQTVAGRAAVTVHPAAYYVGLRGPAGFPEAGKELAIEAMVTDTHGQRVAGRKFEVAISRRSWKSVRQKGAGGGFETVSEPVEEQVHGCKLESEKAAVSCRYKPAEAGFYIVRGAIQDDQGRKHTASIGLYAIGQGWVAWQRNDTERIDLVADKTKYDVGETAKVLVKSPYPEAQALLTVEREGVLQRKQFKLVGSVRTVEIPITEEMVPNVYVSVLLVRPRVAQGGIETGDDPGRPGVRVGLVKLGVERKTRRLSVEVKADKQEYRPGEPVNVDLAVKDHAGKGEQAEVTLYVVDEAVLRLTSYQTPDPIASVYPERPLSVRLAEPVLHLVRKRGFGEKGEEQGGSGGNSEGAEFRSNFQTTVIFNPSLETDASGRAHATFKLPDNLTTFRVMAVAVTPLERFGSGEASIKVNKPLLALPAMPRFARKGDALEAGVVVHSYGGGGGMVTVTAAAEGARLDGPGEIRVEVPEGSPREVRFHFVAERPGEATFRFKAVRGADQDGVEQKIPIELPALPEAVATYGDTSDQRVEGIAPASEVMPGIGGLELTLASTALGNFQQGFRQLVDYPYGCLEQQASRLIPFVALREIASQYGLSWQGPEKEKKQQLAELNAFLRQFLSNPLDVSAEQDPDAVVSSTVRSILSLQDQDGSFRYWPDDACSSSWLSSWATLSLHRASRVGYAVDPQKLNLAAAYVKQAAGGKCHPCEGGCSDETRVMATYVLARMGQPKPSYYGELYSNRAKLSLFGQALLADAMFVGGGDRAQAKALMQELLNHAKESAKGVHLEETQSETYAALWQSDTRTTGAVLETLTDVSPDHPFVAKMAHYLAGARQGDGEWRSTQEAAFSLMALTEVMRTKEKETPDFTAQVLLGGKPIAQEAFKGRSMEVKTKKLPIEQVAQARGQGNLVFEKKGPGVLYYSALLRYAPKELPTKELDRGLYVQRWFEPYAGGGQATKFFAGDLVRVRLRVASNQERHWAAFEVPLPAGLEPVDTSLATTAGQARSRQEEGPGEGYEYESDEDQTSGSASGRDNPWAFRFWSPFTHVERRDTKVVVFADHLPPGIHVFSFVARATTPGKFVLMPAHGELMYEPEVFGRSNGGSFEVTLPPVVTKR